MKLKLYLFVVLLTLTATTAVAQYNPQHVRSITITEPFGKHIDDYTALIELNTSADISDNMMNADGSDIRFTDGCPTGVNYDYYIESGINTSATKIWVRIPSIDSAQVIDIYMHYGDASATVGASNFTATFPNAIITTGTGSFDTISGGTKYIGWLDIKAGDTLALNASTQALSIFAGKAIIAGALLANGSGYQAPVAANANGTGPGGGTMSNNAGAGGGGYGGAGGAGGYDAGDAVGTGGAAYGTATGNDVEPGSSGGSGSTQGGNGGGAIAIYANDLQIPATGSIEANGTDGLDGASTGRCGGGGSGGCIFLSCRTINKQGALSAKGGNGYAGVNPANDSGGGGGGGRIKVKYETGLYVGLANATGGSGGPNGTQLPGQNGQGGSIDQLTVLFPNPVISTVIDVEFAISGDDTICEGETTTLTTAAANILWSTNETTQSITVGPLSSSTYSITANVQVFNLTCTYTDSITVAVNPAPVVVTSDFAACAADTITLLATGNADSYTWSNGISNGGQVILFDTVTLTVTGTYNITGCSTQNQVTVTVNPAPDVFASSSEGTFICQGTAIALVGSGTAVTYAWSDGVTDGVDFVPAATTSYTVTGTDANGCTALGSIPITVFNNPVASATVSNDVVCQGQPVTFSASGGNTYAWSGGVTDNTPTTNITTGTYTVTATDANGCVDTTSVNITVNNNPVITTTAGGSNGSDGSAEVNITTGAAPYTYLWSNGATTANINNLAPGTYTVTVTDNNTCTATADAVVIVLDINSITAQQLFSVYPNPSNGQVNLDIKLDNETSLTVEVFNNMGQVVYNSNITAKNIVLPVNLSGMAAGTYYVRVRTQGAVSQVPVIITSK